MLRFILSSACLAAALLMSPAHAQSPKGDFMAKGKAKAAFKGDSGSAAVAAPSGSIPWIDVHVHLVAPSASGFANMAAEAIRVMDRFSIATAVIMPTPQFDARFEYRDYVAALKPHGNRFVFMAGGGSLNPMIHKQYAKPASVTDKVRRDFVSAAERMLNDGALGFGEIASLHLSLAPGHPYERVEPDHPLLLALVEVAGRRDAVIDLHLDPMPGTMTAPPGLKTPPNPKTYPDNVTAFERLIAHDRSAKIVWAHGGMDPFGGMTAKLVGELMDRHPNLYMSLRPAPAKMDMNPNLGLRIHNKLMHPSGLDAEWKTVLDRHSDRFVIGTDTFHLVEGGTAAVAAFVAGNEIKLQAVNYFLSLLPPDTARRIATENAIRLYKIKPKN